MTPPPRPLDVDELLAAARAKTGLNDYGDEWFVEPLQVLTTALADEARLSEMGLALTQQRLTALLADRLRLRQHQADHPEITEEEVTVAAEICGLPRTGSTLLHRLLASSPHVTSTLSWETSYPLPFPGEGPDAELRKQKARDRFAMFLEMAPDFGDIHTIEWDGPEEDVIVLDRTFTSMSFDSFYWVPTYGDWLREFDQAPAYRELREWLQVLQWQRPVARGKPWVLKSPHHLTAVDTVLDTFPGCKIVMTHRSPTQAVPSYASMVCAISGQYSDDVDPTRGRAVLARPVRRRRSVHWPTSGSAARTGSSTSTSRTRCPTRWAPRPGCWASWGCRRTATRSRRTWPATRSSGTARTPTPPRTSGCPRRSWRRTSRSIRRSCHDPRR